MKFETASTVDQLVWMMRLADLPRGENRAIVSRLFNGDPPWNEQEAEENQIQVNRNDLSGVNRMAQARRQWNQAMLKPGNRFNVQYEVGGTPRERIHASQVVTKTANKLLRESRPYLEQQRASGGNALLHGIGPCVWRTRTKVVCNPIDISSLLIPSETTLDLDESTPYMAFFQEMTPATLYSYVFGRRADPGWNKNLVRSQLKYVGEQVQKQPNASAFQYMPERIEELSKQDLGMWSSDAVPTIDFWDFYFKEREDGPVYRRIILDWGLSDEKLNTYPKGGAAPKKDSIPDDLQNDKDYGGFLYTSGNRKFANSYAEILHCQYADCSAVFPQRYHSIRALGWMLWGVCDLQNRLHCKFTENLFEQLMWYFRVASDEQLKRLKRAEFMNMGIIPPGVEWVKGNERFTPDKQMIDMGFARFRQLLNENASTFVQDGDVGGGKEMTAAEYMGKLNSVNALVSGLFSLSYSYEEFKDREMIRRLCIKNSPDPMARKFQKLCIEQKVDGRFLDPDLMTVTRERALGGGNKSLEMATVQFLQSLRKNLGPDAQRKIDNISVVAATDDAALADQLAPDDADKLISNSVHDAQLSTDRLMRGLPFSERGEMVYEDYVRTWMIDLATMVNANVQNGNTATAPEIIGYENIAKHIEKFLGHMETDPESREKVTAYGQNLSKIMNHVRAFAQRLEQQMKAQAKQGGGNGALNAETMAKIQAIVLQAQAKAQIAQTSAANRTAQKQIQFEMAEQRKNREHNAAMRRLSREHEYELMTGHVERLADISSKPDEIPRPVRGE